MSLLKSVAFFAINVAGRFNSPMAVEAVAKVIDICSMRTNKSNFRTQDFHDVVKHACGIVKAPQDSGSLENFYVGLLKYDLPDQLNDDVFKFLVDVARPYGTRINLAKFAGTTQNPILAERAMDAVSEIERKNGSGDRCVIDCLGRALASNNSFEIKKKAFERLCAIGTNEAYDQAIDGIQSLTFFDNSYVSQEYLVNSIIQSNAADKLALMLKCKSNGIIVGVSNRRSAFGLFCELSKTENDFSKSYNQKAADAAVEMFYSCKDDEYPYMADLAQELLNISLRNESPESMKPLFAAVSSPGKGLGQFVDTKFSMVSLQRKPTTIPTPNLGEVFGQIDTDNAQKGWATPLKEIYMGLCSATARINAAHRTHDTFALEKK